MSYILFPMFQNRFQVFKSPFYHPLIKRIRLFPMMFKRISTIVILSFRQFLDFVHDAATPHVRLYQKQRRPGNGFP